MRRPQCLIINIEVSLFLLMTVSLDSFFSQASAQEQLVMTGENRPTLSSLKILAEEREIDLDELRRELTLFAQPGTTRTMIWTLAFQDSRKAADIFQDRLSQGYSSLKRMPLSKEKENVLMDSVLALGFLAENDKDSFHFLLSRTDTATWMRAVDWQSPRKDYSFQMFVGVSIQALGISGQNEVTGALEGLKHKSPQYLHAFAGDIVQAEFYRYLRKKRGTDGLWRYVMRENGTKQLFIDWSENQGKEIADWANSATRGSQPP